MKIMVVAIVCDIVGVVTIKKNIVIVTMVICDIN